MSPDNVIAGPIVMVLIFVIGHAINIFMNVLGAMVHPMRFDLRGILQECRNTKEEERNIILSRINKQSIKN